MRLSLSSAAAPDASLEELLEACGRRGFAGLELERGHAHGLTGTDPGAARRAWRRGSEAGRTLVGFRHPVPGPEEVASLAAFARALGAPLVLEPDGEGADAALVALERAGSLAAAGARALVTLAGASAETPCLARLLEGLAPLSSDVGVAWEVDPERADPSEAAHRLVERLGRSLRLVRLRGGGPETARQEGHGVGRLMGTLALAGYGGDLVLAPTSSRYRVAWSAWLGRRGGWGCGGKAADPELVRIVREPVVPERSP